MVPDVFTTGQAARVCGVSIMTLKRWLAKGEMVGYRLPGSGDWRISRPEVVRFMERHGIPLERLSAEEHRRRVLVVENQPNILECVREVLSRDERLQVRCAATTSCDACLEAGLFRPDLVVVGLMKPELDGFEVARAIRENSATSEAKILFTNGCSDPECISKMKALGQAYLLRPVQTAPLLEAVYRMAGLPRPKG